MEVHEHPVLKGPVGEISAPIDHLDFQGLHHFINRHNSYSTWEANRYLQLGADPKDLRRFSRRQIAKYRYIARWWFPLAYFMLTYIVRGGFFTTGGPVSFTPHLRPSITCKFAKRS